MDLVSGYDSDSDDEKPAENLSSLLPAPSASSAKSVGLNLPAPSSLTKSSQKRKSEKRQIRIDALDTLQGEDEALPPKRAKVIEASGNGKSGLSGLLGMLPAPKQKGPPPPTDDKDKKDALITNSGILAGSESRLNLDASAVETKKVKGNNDFRAMLGLKPSKLPEKVTSTVHAHPVAPTIIAPSIPKAIVEDLAVAPIPHKQPDFFTLSERSQTAPSNNANPLFSISTAPAVEDEQVEIEKEEVEEEDQYKGWQQGPDGNWFPVTPQAHAAYNAYLSTQATAAPDRFADRPADMMYGDVNSIQSVDANASRQAWQSRPSSKVDSSSTGLDRKYAMAAASIATPDQGIPLVDQEEEVKKMDKKTNMRARKKGQLSALIAQAEENREKLEERWSKGKDGRNAAKEKYGF